MIRIETPTRRQIVAASISLAMLGLSFSLGLLIPRNDNPTEQPMSPELEFSMPEHASWVDENVGPSISTFQPGTWTGMVPLDDGNYLLYGHRSVSYESPIFIQFHPLEGSWEILETDIGGYGSYVGIHPQWIVRRQNGTMYMLLKLYFSSYEVSLFKMKSQNGKNWDMVSAIRENMSISGTPDAVVYGTFQHEGRTYIPISFTDPARMTAICLDSDEDISFEMNGTLSTLESYEIMGTKHLTQLPDGSLLIRYSMYSSQEGQTYAVIARSYDLGNSWFPNVFNIDPNHEVGESRTSFVSSGQGLVAQVFKYWYPNFGSQIFFSYLDDRDWSTVVNIPRERSTLYYTSVGSIVLAPHPFGFLAAYNLRRYERVNGSWVHTDTNVTWRILPHGMHANSVPFLATSWIDSNSMLNAIVYSDIPYKVMVFVDGEYISCEVWKSGEITGVLDLSKEEYQTKNVTAVFFDQRGDTAVLNWDGSASS